MQINTAPMLTDLARLKRLVLRRLQGLKNLLNYPDLTDDEKDTVRRLFSRYESERDMLDMGEDFFRRLPGATQFDDWGPVLLLGQEFLRSLPQAVTYQDWQNVLGLVQRFFQGLRVVLQQEEWREVFELGQVVFRRFRGSDFPHLPTITVPESVLRDLAREIAETADVQGLFVLEQTPIAVRLGGPIFRVVSQ